MPNLLHFKYLAILCSGVVATGSATLVDAGELTVVADTPTVRVSTRPASRNFMELPALRFQFRIQSACDPGAAADSFSLSIADTRVSLGKERLTERSNEIAVTIPAEQIPPVRVAGFCSANTEMSTREAHLRIPSVLSAQSSLLCVSEEGGSDMTYQSTSLDVVVQCHAPADEETD